MDGQPGPKQATLARRMFRRARGGPRGPRTFGRAPSAPGDPTKPRRLAPAARFLAAALLPLAVALVQRAYWPHFTWALLYPAVYFSSMIGGTRAGMLATVEAAALGWLFFTPPAKSWPMHGYQAFVPVGLFVLMGAIFSLSHGRLRKVTRDWRAASLELSELFDNASDGIFVADVSGVCTDVNAAGCRMLGRSRGELVGRTIGDLIGPGQGSRLGEDRKALLRTGRAEVGEWEFKRADGSSLPVEVSAGALPDGRWQAIARDISERKRAEEAHRRSIESRRRDEFRLALESAASAMVMVDGRGRIVLTNAEADKLFGYQPGELAGLIVEVLVPERFKAAHSAHRESFLRLPAAKIQMGTGRVIFGLRKDGGEFPADVGLTRIRLEAESFVVASVIDISERIGAEQKLVESEERLRLLIQSVREYAIFMHDAEGRVTVWNEGAERLLGYRAEEILGRSFTAFYTAEDAAAGKCRADLNAAVERGSLQLEGWRVRKDGSRFMADIVISPVRGSGGKLVGYVKVIRDLTGVKKAEEALNRTAEDLRRTVQDLEGFAYTVSHDLRSPLRAIQGYAHFARERMKGKADPESLGMLERISDSAVRLDRLIRDVLSYSAITRQEVALVPVELDKVVASVISLYPILQSADLRVRGPLGVVLAQESLMLQVVSNLLVNAVKFVPAGREAAIEVRAERAGPGKRHLIVEDNGPGIPRMHWERIFQPFARLPSARGVAGSGIGLAIVKRAVERMGGTIRVESEPCRGTRFTIELTEAGHAG